MPCTAYITITDGYVYIKTSSCAVRSDIWYIDIFCISQEFTLNSSISCHSQLETTWIHRWILQAFETSDWLYHHSTTGLIFNLFQGSLVWQEIQITMKGMEECRRKQSWPIFIPCRYLPPTQILIGKNDWRSSRSVWYLLQYGNSLVKMVVFHCGCAVDCSKWRLRVKHELVVFSSMV